MKSIANLLRELSFDRSNPNLFKHIENFESNHYKMKNNYEDIKESFGKLRYEMRQIKSDDKRMLTDISKKMSTTFKSFGDDNLIRELALYRAKILDHFALAYLAESGLKPGNIKLIQGFNDKGYVEMYFEKNSKIILPGD